MQLSYTPVAILSVLGAALISACSPTQSKIEAAPSPAAASAPQEIGPTEKLKVLYSQLQPPAAIMFGPPITSPNFEELAGKDISFKDQRITKSWKRILSVASDRASNPGIAPRPSALEVELVASWNLLFEGRALEAKEKAERLEDARLRALALAFINFETDEGAVFVTLADASEYLSTALIYRVIQRLALSGNGQPFGLAAQFLSANGGSEDERKALEKLVAQAWDVPSIPADSYWWSESNVGAAVPMDLPLNKIYIDAAISAWKFVRAEADKASSVTPKGEFESTADFEARKAKAAKNLSEKAAEISDNNRQRFVSKFRDELEGNNIWILNELIYNADKQQFSAKIITPSKQVVVPAIIDVPVADASVFKDEFNGVRIQPTFVFGSDGSLTISHMRATVGMRKLSTNVGWKIGAVLNEKESEGYSKIYEDIRAKEEAEKKIAEARRAAEQKVQAEREEAEQKRLAELPVVKDCLARVQQRMGATSSINDMVASVQRQQRAVHECYSLGAGQGAQPGGELANLSAEDRIEEYAKRIENNSNQACSGIANILRKVVQVQGPASPKIAGLLGDAQRYGCL